MKTSELSGFELDLAVAKAEGEQAELNHGEVVTWKTIGYHEYRLVWRPSTDWAQGGTIIEREGVGLMKTEMGSEEWEACKWIDPDKHMPLIECGPTPLIAAMRCYVASKLGDEVEVIDNFLEGK